MKRLAVKILWLMFWGPSFVALSSPPIQCPNIHLKTPIQFSENELRLICGDPDNPEWQQVPTAEAKRFLTVFLQERGYHNPLFENMQGRLIVEPGKVSRLRAIHFYQHKPSVDVKRLRNVMGKPITPELLDRIENWVLLQLKVQGYACAEVTSASEPSKGTVTVYFTEGDRHRIISIRSEPVKGLSEEALRRYDAFSLGDFYSFQELELTKLRLITQGLLEATDFREVCTERGVILNQRNMAGPPKMIKVGFGFNTEHLGILRAAFHNTRLGQGGASIELSTFLSFREQHFRVGNQWYYVPSFPRHFIQTNGSITRYDERHSESFLMTVNAQPSLQYDLGNTALSASIGPSFSHSKTVRGKGPKDQSMLGLEVNAQIMSHGFELFQHSPEKGYRYEFTAFLTHRSLAAPISAQKLSFMGQQYWNLGKFDPPLWVFGIRGGFDTTVTKESLNGDQLPTHFRHFLGGASTLRGFNRKELPGEQGALSSLYLGIELRLNDLLPFKIQPFLFTDVGLIGSEAFSLTSPIYWSPGIGLRWESPLGPIRTTFARGIVEGESHSPLAHWQFYFTFGEEF